jgi:hypothetical protein
MKHSLFGRDRFLFGIFRGLFQLASGFCSSPPSASRSCSPCYHCFVLCLLPVIRFTIRRRPSKIPFRSTTLFNSNRAAKVSQEGRRRYCCGRRTACFAQRVDELIGSSRSTSKEPVRLRRIGRPFVRRTQRNQILRVKCAERGPDGRPDPYDAFFHVWAEQCDPKIAAKEELGAAHGGGASRMGRAMILHLLNGRCRMVHDAAPTGRMIVFVHPRL